MDNLRNIITPIRVDVRQDCSIKHKRSGLAPIAAQMRKGQFPEWPSSHQGVGKFHLNNTEKARQHDEPFRLVLPRCARTNVESTMNLSTN